MIAPEQAFLVLQNLDEAETLVNKLTIEDLRAFSFTFGLSQGGTKASLKEQLMEYYEEKFKSSLGSPVPMPRRRHSAESAKTTEKETFSSAPVDVEQRMDDSLKQFCVSLTESIKESTKRMMRTFDKPSEGDPRIDSGPHRFVPDIKFVAANRKLNFLEKNAKGVCEKLLDTEAAHTRIESQLKRLSKYETHCLHSVEEIFTNVEEDSSKKLYKIGTNFTK